MIRTIIAFLVTRIGITLLAIAPPNDFEHDWFFKLPKWMAAVLFFPIKTSSYSIIAVPMQLCWYGMLILSIIKSILGITVGSAIQILIISTMISVLVCGIYVIKRRKL